MSPFAGIPLNPISIIHFDLVQRGFLGAAYCTRATDNIYAAGNSFSNINNLIIKQ
ncbi:hypothetical protein PV783_30290 [Chitinophaga sp. CC14]|uniref:hypothetical protein n=1 Tax=Chitinophaga sp. CC14 TaxID=3029199 RepID=UPI003B79B588